MIFDPVAEGMAYWCPNGGGHMMTTYNTTGYAHLDFTPRQAFTDITRVCWDANATNLGNRKWLQVAIVPEALYQANGQRLDYISPMFNPGPGFWGVDLAGGVFLYSDMQGRAHVHQNGGASNWWQWDPTISDKATRWETCITDLGDGRVQIDQDRPTPRRFTLAGSFPAGAVRVIWQDVSYNPDKAVGESPPAAPDPYTWHWDNLQIQ
jgi:hypothetical protein